MVLYRSVPSAILVATIIVLSHTGNSLARNLGLQGDGYLLSKRNSWWSKKSVDSSSDFSQLIPDTNIDTTAFDENNSDASSQLYGCYTASCVPEFIACAAKTKTAGSFEICKLQHRACAVHCWELTNEESTDK